MRRENQTMVNVSKELIEYLQTKALYRDSYEDVLRRLLALPALVRRSPGGRGRKVKTVLSEPSEPASTGMSPVPGQPLEPITRALSE